MTERVDTDMWLKEQSNKAFDAVKRSGNIDVGQDDFMTATQLANGYVFFFGVEGHGSDRTVIVKVLPGLVMPPADVELDIYEPTDSEDDNDAKD